MIKIEMDPVTGEPTQHADWAGKHPAVVNSYILDRTPGSTGITTYTGIMFDVFNPDSWVFDLQDMSHALSNTCRFGGHVDFYSVAEHCIRVSEMLASWGENPRILLLGLMHDCIEAYIGDIPRPIKKHSKLGDETVTDLEKRMELALFEAYGLLDLSTFDEDWARIKEADMAVYALERDERPHVGAGLPPYLAKDCWLAAFNGLIGSMTE